MVEMKCEIEFQDFKFLTLSNPMQLEHHRKPGLSVVFELHWVAQSQEFEVLKFDFTFHLNHKCAPCAPILKCEIQSGRPLQFRVINCGAADV